MAFPGHFKSLQLSQLIDSLNRDSAVSSPPKQAIRNRKHSSSDAQVQQADNGIVAGGESTRPQKQETVDDKGNRPTRSLWVGNIPQDLDAPTLRTNFARFGVVRSTKILRGMRCAFVNFENTSDAIAAWRICHNSELFEPGCIVHVRFTGTENEAKQAKDQLPTRKSSLSKPFEPVQCSNSRKSSNNEELRGRDPLWPNGLPPAGPKSERRNVSPPQLRRGDSYRPSGRSEPERRFSQNSRRFGEERDSQRNHDIYRPSYENAFQSADSTDRHDNFSQSEHDLNVHSPPANLVSGDQILSIVSERHESTPYSPPAEISSPVQMDQEILESPRSDIAGIHFSLQSPTTPKILLSEFNLRQKCLENGESILPPAGRNMRQSTQSQILCTDSIDPETNAVDPVGVPAVHLSPERESSNETAEIARSRRNRMLSPLQRLRHANDDASSVVSDWTTSSKSSMRRRKCADCKKPESSVMILIPCSTCPRRFHSSCGDPRPSLSDDLRYVCGRCLRKQNRAENLGVANSSKASKILAAEATINSMEKELSSPRHPVHEGNDWAIGKFHDVTLSRPLYQTVEISPSNPQICSTSRRSTLSSEQPMPTLTAQCPMRNRFLSQAQVDGCAEASPVVKPTPTAVKKSAQRTKEAYKHVTCPWWRKDPEHGCSLEEPECMFCHRETGIYSPDGHSPAKHWTCRRWYLTKDCPNSKENCLYAHKDKGLYVGLDGKASKKHITCYWWKVNGRCKHSELECLFTHQDTGIYARDPGWTAHGNSIPTSISATTQLQRSRIDSDRLRGVGHVNNGPPESFHRGGNTFSDEKEANFVLSPQGDMQASKPKNTSAAFRSDSAMTTDLSDMFDKEIVAWKQLFLKSLEEDVQPIDMDIEKEVELVQDPRKTRRERAEQSVLQDLPAISVPDVEDRDEAQTQMSDVTSGFLKTNILASTENDSTERSRQAICSLKKKCKSCMKTIFSGDVCVGCKPALEGKVLGPVPPTIIDENLEVPQQTVSPRSPQLDDLVANELNLENSVQDATFEIRQLKRKPSQDAMFVSNKRSRLNPQKMASRYRPPDKPEKYSSTDELERLQIEKRNLQQLLSREKATEIVPPPSNDANKENRRPAESACSSDLTSPVEMDSVQPDFFSTPDLTEHDSIRETQHSVESSALQECALVLEPTEEASADCSPLDDDNNSIVNASGIASNSKQSTSDSSHARDTEVVTRNNDPDESLPTRSQGTACKECSRRHMRCTHFDRTLSKRAVNMESAQVDVCDHCRKKHKKCLHQADGKLDGKKCFEWLQDRTRRGTTSSDRKKDEQMAIDEAARRYELSSCKAPSRGPSVSTFSEEEVVRLDSEDDADEVSTAATSHTEHENDQLISLHVQKRHAVLRSEHYVETSDLEVPSTTQHKSKPLSLPLSEPAEMERTLERAMPTPQSSERRKRNNLRLIEDPAAIQNMKSLGITFESDSEGDYDEPIPVLGQPAPPISKAKHSIDPLHQRDQTWSRDLYRLFPEADPNTNKSDIEYLNEGIPSITMGQGLKNRKLLRRRTLLRNLLIHGNANWEVNRNIPDTMVSALVEKTVPPSQEARLRDRYAPDTIETTSQTITFSEFLGVGEAVEPCLIGKGSGATLAFREMSKGHEMDPWLFGKRRRVGEIEKWPVYDK